MTAPSEAEATIAVDAAARKAWDMRRAELREQGFPSPEFEDLDPTNQLTIRQQVLPFVWAALEALPRPSEIRDSVAEAIEEYAVAETERLDATGGPGLVGNWIGGIRQGVLIARGQAPESSDRPLDRVPPGPCGSRPAIAGPGWHHARPVCELRAGHAGLHECDRGAGGTWTWSDET